MCWNILPTCSVLNSRFPLPSLECYLYNNASESLEHLMLQCDWVAQVWLLAPWPLILNKLSSLSMEGWIKVIIFHPQVFLKNINNITRTIEQHYQMTLKSRMKRLPGISNYKLSFFVIKFGCLKTWSEWKEPKAIRLS